MVSQFKTSHAAHFQLNLEYLNMNCKTLLNISVDTGYLFCLPNSAMV